jgi:hypothetical protein
MWNDLAGLVGICLIILYFDAIAFVISLLWRIAVALEKKVAHQLEMARDLKRIAEANDSKEP